MSEEIKLTEADLDELTRLVLESAMEQHKTERLRSPDFSRWLSEWTPDTDWMQ